MTNIIALSISILVSVGLAIFLAGMFWIIIRNIDPEKPEERSLIHQLYMSVKRSLF